MSHTANTRAFARRMGRGFWNRARRFSESAKPAPATSLLAGTTGADSGSISKDGEHAAVTRCSDESNKRAVARCVGGTDAPHVASLQSEETAGASANCGQKGGDTDSIQNQQRPSPPSTHSAGGGVCCVMLAQVHYDRWATLAVIAIFCSVFAVAIIRANRFPKPLRRGGRDEEKPNEPQGMALAHDSEAAGLSRINRGLTPDGRRAVENPAGRVMPQQPLSSRPPSPPRGPFAGHGNRKASD